MPFDRAAVLAFLPALPPIHAHPPSPPSLCRRPTHPIHATLTTAELLAANETFYAALRTRSLPAMKQIYLPSSDAISVAHPLRGLAVGAEQVLSAWAGIFALGDVSSCDVKVLRVGAERNVGWVICHQVIGGERGKKAIGGERVATNIFHPYKGEWRMAHHSSSLIADLREVEDPDDTSSGGSEG